MSSVCCGTKKQKLNNSTSIICNGSSDQNGKLAQKEMGFYCFDVLYSHLHNLDCPKSPNFSNVPFPLFVTWEIGEDRRLRGCIGSFSPMPLHDGLKEYAITSACHDSRFSPITVEEISKLHVSVSLLRHFEDGIDYNDFQIGIHGVRIEFQDDQGHKRSSTFLPNVVSDTGYNHIQTIDALLRKGGFKGVVTPEIRRKVKLTRYQSEKVHVSYGDYLTNKMKKMVTIK